MSLTVNLKMEMKMKMEMEMNDHDRITRVATGVLCVIQVTVDCFMKNMTPYVYLDAYFCSNRGKLICVMWMGANHHI